MDKIPLPEYSMTGVSLDGYKADLLIGLRLLRRHRGRLPRSPSVRAVSSDIGSNLKSSFRVIYPSKFRVAEYVFYHLKQAEYSGKTPERSYGLLQPRLSREQTSESRSWDIPCSSSWLCCTGFWLLGLRQQKVNWKSPVQKLQISSLG